MRNVLLTSSLAALAATPLWAYEPESVSARFKAENRAEGLRMGGWEVRPLARLRGGYDGNPNASAAAPRESAVMGLRGAVEAARQWGAAELGASADVEKTWVTASPENDQFAASATLRGAISAGGQLKLRGAVGVAIGQDPVTASDNGVLAGGVLDPYIGRPEYLRVPLEIGASRDMGRFFWDTGLRATYSRYEPLRTVGGLRVAQDFSTGWETAAEARLGYRFSEGYGAFVRAEANRRSFVDATADNRGLRISSGVEFELTRILTGEITAGWAQQTYDVTGETNSAFVYGLGLNWFVNPLLSVELDAIRDFQSEQSVDALGVATTVPVTRDEVSVRVEVEPMRRWYLSAGARYSQNASEDGLRDNSLTEFNLGSELILTRYLRLNADYAYTLAETAFTGEIVRNAVSVGITAEY